ncbi:MAG: hypothetical protein RLZ98_149 [Pseudomonadota bacterium]|jgi:Fe-S cluster assembly protein SufD
MTVAVAKTKAEQALGQQFEAIAGALPGSGWVGDLRREAIGAFQALGLPSRRVEAFKYTDLRQRISNAYAPGAGDIPVAGDDIDAALGPLAGIDADRLVLVNGIYRDDLSTRDGFGAEIEFIALGPLLAKAPAWFAGKFAAGRVGEFDAVTALNAAYMRDGVMLKVKPGQSAQRPIVLVHARAGGDVAAFSRNIIAIEEGASALLIEVFVAVGGAGAGQDNSFADVTVAAGASFEHVVCRIGDGREQDVAHTVTDVGADATYRSFHLLAGAGLARHQALLKLTGEGGRIDASGAILGRGRDHMDATLVVDHLVPNCRSREHYKAVLDDEARGVFQGKVIVRPGAQKTDGKMMAQALMLGAGAEFDSKPELEIYADDVQCGHGSTCDDLDKDQLFFCRSRGLSEGEARALLVRAFVGDVLTRVEDEALRGALEAIADAWLSGDGKGGIANG